MLDTCIVVQYLRANPLGQYIERTYSLRSRAETPLISIVTHGELLSLVQQLHWGQAKQDHLQEILHEFVVVDISHQEILDRYAEIDTYTRNLPSGSRKMGKNDLWIAATASVANAYLLTTDNDFDPLGGNFLKLVKMDLTST